MKKLTLSDRNITLFGDTETASPIVWLNTFENEGESVWNACQSLHAPHFLLAAIPIIDWNGDLSPWESPRVFKDGSDFAGNADKFLHELETSVIPEVTAHLPFQPQYHAIAGYSLAGLFAVYSLYRTDLFHRAASASGSFWFPGFPEFVASHKMQSKPDAVYFSLGDTECRTRNPVMATVQENTEKLYAHFKSQGVQTIFELNPGNHFQAPALRMAKGIRWMLERG